MDEENKQNSGISEKVGEAVKQGTKKQAKKALKQVFKTIIMPILPYILLTISIIIIGTLIIATIDNFINHWSEIESKTSNSDSITYTQKTDENTKPDRIVVDPKKRSGKMKSWYR